MDIRKDEFIAGLNADCKRPMGFEAESAMFMSVTAENLMSNGLRRNSRGVSAL